MKPIKKMISIDFLVNDIKQVGVIEEMIKQVRGRKKLTKDDFSHREIPDFSHLFSKCGENKFVKFIVFSPNSISKEVALKVSSDWFSPFPSTEYSLPIDGVCLSVNMEDAELHLQTLVQRYKTGKFALNLSVKTYIAKPLEILPKSFNRASTRDGFSQILNVTVPRSYRCSNSCSS